MVEEHLVRLSWVNVPPYPQVTLDNFGFPVGGRLAVRRAVFRHRLPKVALFGPKNTVFLGPEINFLWTASTKNCYHHDGTPKRQLWLYTLTCHNISKRFAAGCYFERASTNLTFLLECFLAGCYYRSTYPLYYTFRAGEYFVHCYDWQRSPLMFWIRTSFLKQVIWEDPS